MDIISFNEAATANERIEKFNANPDSDSGIVTVPKVIESGESVTVPAGRVAVLPNVHIDGTLNVLGEVFIPAGSTVDMGNGLAINGEKVVMSVPTSYHLLQGNLAVDNTVITQGFNTTLYTGNGSTQSINTGIDMDTQWGDTAEEKFGGLIWLKSRSVVNNNFLVDTIRGVNAAISSDLTSAQISTIMLCTGISSNGFSVGNSSGSNTNAATYASWNFQTTHRISGVTNHGKPYTCHYNPFTGFTIVKYEGSGLTGHEIPHHLSRKLGFLSIKGLGETTNWLSFIGWDNTNLLQLNTTSALTSAGTYTAINDNVKVSIGTGAGMNTSTQTYILYGWANSYFDEANKLIGNYEVGVYQGTGAAGNKVKTRGKPAWVMIKRLDSTGAWNTFDNIRDTTSPNNAVLTTNTSSAEWAGEPDVYNIYIVQDGFTTSSNHSQMNASGGQYLYMVAYDTNSDGGGSYYPKTSDTAHVKINNALIPIAKGSDINGLKNVMLSKNETITGLTYTAGKNYVYCDANGSYGVKSVAPNYGTTNPANGGDFYNVLENKWYTSADIEISEGRNYLNHIVHADNDGGVLYVEELPKIEYKDVIKANEYQGKNACTAWVNFDGTTTPPTIRDSYNVSSVVRTATGQYDVYFTAPMDNVNYSIGLGCGNVALNHGAGTITERSSNEGNFRFVNKISIQTSYSFTNGANNTADNSEYCSVQILGGKN